MERGHRNTPGPGKSGSGSVAPVQSPGKRTLTETLPRLDQATQDGALGQPTGHEAAIRASAARGVATPGSTLPFADIIQRAFGRHDISSVQAHTGGDAAASARDIGAEAYTRGEHVAFAGAPDLFVAAHEAAHVVQQQAGVQPAGGVGRDGDAHERHADAVAERVVAGRSAVDLLEGLARPSSPVAPPGGAVQRYSKKGNARISDRRNMVVAADGPHHRAFVTPELLEAGQKGLREESQITLGGGKQLKPRELGLGSGDVADTCVEVEVRQTDTPQSKEQRAGAKDVSKKFKKAAKTVLEQLAEPTTEQKRAKVAPDVDISGLVVERDILGNNDVMEKLAATYAAITSKRPVDFSPENIARLASAQGLSTKIIYFLIGRMAAYHKRVLEEYERGGFTTPNDCGETATNFVRGAEIGATVVPREEVKAKGYEYHFFSMLFRDEDDRISLENAVGANKLEQLWKQAAFDADWRWEMRGTARPAGEDGIAAEEAHGIGEPREPPSALQRGRTFAARMEIQDALRRKK